MKVLRNLLGILLCCSILFMLASCSNISQSYSDKVNDAYQSGTPLLYKDVKEEFGKECIDCTLAETGTLVCVKGLSNDNDLDTLAKASDDTKYDILVITVVQGKCTYAHFSTGTTGEVRASLMNK